VRLYLIRHGETEWSLSGRHTSRTDLSLTAKGADAARELAPWLRGVPFAHMLTSPLRRARQTCELAGLGAAAETALELSEWDYGDYEGLRSADIHKDRPDWDVFQDGCPHGEAPQQVSDRADRLIASLHGTDGDIALFSHGQFGCVLAARWIGLAAAEGQHLSLGPASLSILGHRPGYPGVRSIALWNATPASMFGGHGPPAPDAASACIANTAKTSW